MTLTITRNEYAASARTVSLISELVKELGGNEIRVENFDDLCKEMSMLFENTTILEKVEIEEEALTISIKEEFTVELFDKIYNPTTMKIISLVSVTLKLLKGILNDTKKDVAEFVSRWTR